jgi:hypothetical protein
VLAGEDEQRAEHGGGLGEVEAEPGEDPPVREVAEAVLDGCAGGGQGLVCLPLRGGGLAGPGGFPAGEAEVGEGAEPGSTQPAREVVVAGGREFACGAAAGGGDPDQVACLVGEGEEQQPVFLIFSVVVLPVRGT